MSKLPVDIEVLEPITGAVRETRYRLPLRTHESVKQIFRAAVGGAIVLGLTPLVFSIFFAVVVPREDFEFWLIAVLMPIGFFGSFLYPLAACIMFLGAAHRWSRTEIVCTPASLSLFTRFGPFWWNSRLPLTGLNGFRVQRGGFHILSLAGVRKYEAITAQDVATLFADYERGRSRLICSGYAPEWLLGLAAELTARAGAGRFKSGELTVTETSDDPAEIQARHERPSSSDARVQLQGDLLTIELPRLGWRRAVPASYKFFCLAWNGFNLFFFGMFFPALFAGKVEWNGGPEKVSILFGILFSLPFLGLGFGMLAYWFAAARYSATLQVSPEQLTFRCQSIFGEQTTRWQRSEVQAVRVVSKETDKENHTWTSYLQITAANDKTQEILGDRDKSELEWIATTLCKALGLNP